MLRFGAHPKKTDLPISESLKPKKNKNDLKKQYKIGALIIITLLLILFYLRSSEQDVFSIDESTVEAHSQRYDQQQQSSNGRVYEVTADGLQEIASPTKEGNNLKTGDEDKNDETPENFEIYDLMNYQGSPLSKLNGDNVLLCVPLRDAEKVLPLMFRNMMNMTYYHSLIDIAFLVSDCSEGDNTMERLVEYSQAMQRGKLLELLDSKEDSLKAKGIKGSSDLYLQYMPKDYVDNVKAAYSPPYHEEYSKPFRSVQIYTKDFGQVIGQGFSDRHDVKVQGIRRKLMGRARNWLITTALKPYHSWVYWRDADIETSPGDILEYMMRFSSSYDIMIPNVWRPLPTFLGNEQAYDLNSWIESEEGLKLASTLEEDDVIVEGYAQYPTWRVHLAYIRRLDGDPNEVVELDGVGGVSILAKAKVFRQGGMFPAFTFLNHAETEAFGKLTRKMGFKIAGLPHYTIWHIYEPSEDDLLEISKLERKKRRLRNH